MRPKKTVKLQDVAEALGVSVVTVSNALSGKPGVSEKLREEVKRKAKELGYVYAPKRHLAAESSLPFIAVVLKGNSGAGESLEAAGKKAAERIAAAYGYDVRLQLIQENDNVEEAFQPLTGNPLLRGIIVCGRWGETELENLQRLVIVPVVGVSFAYVHVNIDFVLSDSFHAGFERMRELILQEYNTVMILRSGGTADISEVCDEDRLYGCGEALFYYAGRPIDGISEEPAQGISSGESAGKSHPEIEILSDRVALISRLENGAVQDRTVILCLDWKEAESVRDLRAIQNAGIAVVDCGRPDPEAMGTEAADVLIRRIKMQDKPGGVHFVKEIL